MFVELSWDDFIREYNARTGGRLDDERLSGLHNFVVYALNEGRPDEETAERVSFQPGIGVLYVPRIVCGDALCFQPTVSSDFTWDYQGEDDAYLVFCHSGRVFGYKVGSSGSWRFEPPVPALESDD